MVKQKKLQLKTSSGIKDKMKAPFIRLKNYIADFFYSISVRLHNRRIKKGKVTYKSLSQGTRSRNLFLFCVLVIPVLQFVVFYIGVNINSILLSFKEYDINAGRYFYVGLKNFKEFINDLRNNYVLAYATKNSLILYAIGLFISMPLQIMSSFFVYKKIPLSEFFKVFLYLPSIISSIVMTIIFKYFVDKAVPEMLRLLGMETVPNFFLDTQLAFPTIIIYNVWFGLGGGIILYTGAMSRIPDSLIESAQLEGVTLWKEFWYITVPLIFPTITVFLVTGVAGIFTNQAAIYNFFGADARQDLYTYGYFLFIKVVGDNASLSLYPYASAAGLLFTFIAAPITIFVKYLLEKYGPSAEF